MRVSLQGQQIDEHLVLNGGGSSSSRRHPGRPNVFDSTGEPDIAVGLERREMHRNCAVIGTRDVYSFWQDARQDHEVPAFGRG